MRFAYADPPYFGCGKKYLPFHAEALDWDDLATHRALVDRLVSDFPDGWALSTGSKQLRHILPMCPDDCRVAAWVKPWAVFFPNVGVAYAWEPVIWRGGRKRTREQDTIRDWVAANITMLTGLPGAKPRDFNDWILDLLNVEPGDEFCDLFPGTGSATNAFMRRNGGAEQFELFP